MATPVIADPLAGLIADAREIPVPFQPRPRPEPDAAARDSRDPDIALQPGAARLPGT
jgi:hypothetical protein